MLALAGYVVSQFILKKVSFHSWRLAAATAVYSGAILSAPLVRAEGAGLNVAVRAAYLAAFAAVFYALGMIPWTSAPRRPADR